MIEFIKIPEDTKEIEEFGREIRLANAKDAKENIEF